MNLINQNLIHKPNCGESNLFFKQAKKTLQEEIDRYIREQIDMAGEAISIAVRNKISNGDNILTYGWYVNFLIYLRLIFIGR